MTYKGVEIGLVPTIEMIEEYIKEKGYKVTAQQIIDRYEPVGWKAQCGFPISRLECAIRQTNTWIVKGDEIREKIADSARNRREERKRLLEEEMNRNKLKPRDKENTIHIEPSMDEPSMAEKPIRHRPRGNSSTMSITYSMSDAAKKEEKEETVWNEPFTQGQLEAAWEVFAYKYKRLSPSFAEGIGRYKPLLVQRNEVKFYVDDPTILGNSDGMRDLRAHLRNTLHHQAIILTPEIVVANCNMYDLFPFENPKPKVEAKPKEKPKPKKSYSDMLNDPRWQKKRLEVYQRDNWTCQLCGNGLYDGVPLNIHHKVYRKGCSPWEYEDSDLLTICENCHRKLHGK